MPPPPAPEFPTADGVPASRRPRARTLYAAAAAFVIIGGAAVVISTSRGGKAEPVIQVAPALTVTCATPREAAWPSTLAASGAIAPWQEAIIGTRIGSYQLIDVRVNVGDEVKKGQILARLDSDLLHADEMQLQANYDQAEANHQRAVRLKSSGATSDQSALQFETEAKSSAALLVSKRLQLRYTEVVAPDDGVISARMAALGAVVPAGQELFRLIRQNRLEWRGELTAAQIAQVAPGQHVALTLPDGGAAVASVRQIAPSLDAQSRLGIVYADLEPGSRARAGMYASGEVELGERRGLVAPAESVVLRDGRSFVLALADFSATPRVSLRAVTVGRRRGDEVEILQGLGASDRVVVAGAGFLNDGDVVRLVASSADRPAEGRGEGADK